MNDETCLPRPHPRVPSSWRGIALLSAFLSILLAWAADYSLVKPMNRFSARRNRHDTLLRVAAEIKK